YFVELGPAAQVLASPRHPYTRGLVDSLPDRAFTPIPGLPPLLTSLPSGCPFRPRCPRAVPECHHRPALNHEGLDHEGLNHEGLARAHQPAVPSDRPWP